MQAYKVILLVACLTAVASARSSTSLDCENCKVQMGFIKEVVKASGLRPAARWVCTGETIENCVELMEGALAGISKETPESLCRMRQKCPPGAPSDLARQEEPMCSLCEPCKQLAQMIKARAKELKELLKLMCLSCGPARNVQKCEQAIDKLLSNIDEKSPDELCTELGLCMEE